MQLIDVTQVGIICLDAVGPYRLCCEWGSSDCSVNTAEGTMCNGVNVDITCSYGAFYSAVNSRYSLFELN